MSWHKAVTIYTAGGTVTVPAHVLHAGGAHLVRVRDLPEVRALLAVGATIIDGTRAALRVLRVSRSDCRGWLNAACEVTA